MRAAIIGYGVIGKVHAAAIAKHGTLVAVADVNPAALSLAPCKLRYTDYKKMLDEVKPDVVHICTPHYLHAEMVIEALNRGINVLCEKPLCIDLRDVERILKVERKSTARLAVCHQNRYNPENRFVKEYLQNMTVDSAVGVVAWNRDAAYYRSAEWRGKRSTEGGGVLINQALHTLDLLLWLCGEPKSVMASMTALTLKGEIEVEDTAVVVCSGGADFTLFATNSSAVNMPVELTLAAGGKIIKVLPHEVVVGGESKTFVHDDIFVSGSKACYGNGHEALVADYYRCIEDGRDFWINGEEGAKVVRLILAAYKSNGERVDV